MTTLRITRIFSYRVTNITEYFLHYCDILKNNDEVKKKIWISITVEDGVPRIERTENCSSITVKFKLW